MSNIAIEGKFLIGACVASVAASTAMLVGGEGANPTVAVLIGIVSAAIAGALVSLLLAWLGIRWKVDQIIAGIVINIGAIGITNFLFLRVLAKQHPAQHARRRSSPSRSRCSRSSRCSGRSCSRARPYLYFTLIVMVGLRLHAVQTRWGLRLRASRREAVGRRDRRHRRHQDPLPGDAHRRADGGHRRLVAEPRVGGQLPDEDERRDAASSPSRRSSSAPGTRSTPSARRMVFGFADSTPGAAVGPRRGRPAAAAQQPPVHHRRSSSWRASSGRVRGPAAAGQPYDQG